MIVILVFFVEVDIKLSDEINQKTKTFTFCPENEINPQDKISKNMKDLKPINYIQNDKLICDRTDKKNQVLHYRVLKFYVRHGMVVDKNHEIIFF